jgi:hypothetical protein
LFVDPGMHKLRSMGNAGCRDDGVNLATVAGERRKGTRLTEGPRLQRRYDLRALTWRNRCL